MGNKLQLVKQRDRTGLEALTEASAFLGGIFFTALIFLVDKKEQLGSIPHINISTATIIAIPLSFSVIMFVYSTFIFAVTCNSKEENYIITGNNTGLTFFAIGFFSMFVSLSIFLFAVDLIVGFFGLTVMIGSFIYVIIKITKCARG